MEVALRFVTTPVASQLTGLSTEKLREWTSRRALVPADVPPRQKGSPAKFSWQTILILRIAVVMRDMFNLELESHKTSFANLSKELGGKSFIALWGQTLALTAEGEWTLVGAGATVPEKDSLLIRLDPHLAVLREGFALPDSNVALGQLDLFTLPTIAHHPRGEQKLSPARITRRRSA